MKNSKNEGLDLDLDLDFQNLKLKKQKTKHILRKPEVAIGFLVEIYRKQLYML
jgi:hypothetical protein